MSHGLVLAVQAVLTTHSQYFKHWSYQ